MAKSLLEQLPEIVSKGRQVAEKFLKASKENTVLVCKLVNRVYLQKILPPVIGTKNATLSELCEFSKLRTSASSKLQNSLL